MNTKFITKDQLHDLLNQEKRDHGNYLHWEGLKELGAQGLLYETWIDQRSNTLLAIKAVRTVHMGFNSNEEDKVE